MPTAQTLEIARNLRARLAGDALTQRQAKLYSQQVRREMGQAGLRTFRAQDVGSYLDQALLLLDCALLERQEDLAGSWRDGVKRAAEILEWLSQRDLRPAEVPVHFLAAAAYQVAGYPAMALGHLQRMSDDPFSKILREYLRGNFPDATRAIFDFWGEKRELSSQVPEDDLSFLGVEHTIRCIGTICAYLRNGSDEMLDRALQKLDHISSLYLHSRDHYSHLLAKLTAITSHQFVDRSLWPQIAALRAVSSASAAAALQQFGKAAYLNRRALVWPAQASGIEKLIENNSFVLCTPTGSGKTTVATLAVVQALFADTNYDTATLETLGLGNLILYIVPSRAIAAEVEQRFSQDLQGIAAQPVVVTGLYGGVDWGPTDAWIQTGQPTVVICTFEKADALVRYLGILFLNRVRLVVIDEAHTVEQNVARLQDVTDGTSRSYRLEQLGTRLLRAQDNYHFRLIALSAVASQAAPALARWISSNSNATPVTSAHRSTRQMLGRLEVNTSGAFTISYDLMNGQSLTFEDERRNDSPYVPTPFRALPNRIGEAEGPEARLRIPTFWAALHLAAERADGARPSVLISLTQHIESFAAECADQLDEWSAETLPNFTVADRTSEQWTRCLASAADYFTEQSVEYRLLTRGIALHHGKMPNLLARRLKSLIDAGHIRVIIATSTLSEGVNIPVNYLLIPSVYRATSRLSTQELMNLIGRVGRPGVSTEGHALVVLPERARNPQGQLVPTRSRQWIGYEELRNAVRNSVLRNNAQPLDNASSALTLLLINLERAWRQLTGNSTQDQFTEWLERTAVAEDTATDPSEAFRLLDSLDGFLIAAIHEVEELLSSEVSPDVLETELIRIWQSTYAFATAKEEERLRRIWLDRGRQIKVHYGDSQRRRQIYKTSLNPRSALSLLNQAAQLKNKLLEGSEYAVMTIERRFQFVREVLELVSAVPSFKIALSVGRGRNAPEWTTLLRWWLAKGSLPRQPQPRQITNWYAFVSENFIYRAAWGIGSVLGLLLDLEGEQQPIRALEIEDWPRSGLPWIAFWLKELLTWGTLEPVAAFLLARGGRLDRPTAEAEARQYYESNADVSANDLLDPRRILTWIDTRAQQQTPESQARTFEINAALEREAAEYSADNFGVFPLAEADNLVWVNSAGHTLAQSTRPEPWVTNPASYDFNLDVPRAIVTATPYLPYGS